jgi:hypothetical protein
MSERVDLSGHWDVAKTDDTISVVTSHPSGAHRSFPTGAIRDARVGKGRCDLLMPRALLEVAKHLERGAERYDDRNWEKGMPLSAFVDSGLRHLLRYMAGEVGEDHLVACAWNILAAIETRERSRSGILPSELEDIPPKG